MGNDDGYPSAGGVSAFSLERNLLLAPCRETGVPTDAPEIPESVPDSGPGDRGGWSRAMHGLAQYLIVQLALPRP
jgi:hypothetical protein